MFVIESFDDALLMIARAAVIGAIAGLIASLARDPRNARRSAFGMDNCLRFPRWIMGSESKKHRGWNLESLGVALVGAAGAIFVVFAAGIGDQQLGDEIVTGITYTKLITLSIVGGSAGVLVLRTLAKGGTVSIGMANAALAATAQGAAEAAHTQKTPTEVQAAALEAGRAVLGTADRDEPRPLGE